MNPEQLLYSETHEWAYVSEEGGEKIATVGISAFAVEQLTDLVFMELPAVGRQLQAGDEFGEVESVKAVSPVYSPVSGEVIEVNTELPDKLEILNQDPYDAGWIMKVKVTDDASLAKLMDFDAYQNNARKKVDEMPFTFNTREDQQTMLEAVGVESIDQLFQCIPPEYRLGRPLDIPPALSELELSQHMSALAGRNSPASEKVCFLGGGSYDHFVPAVVDALASRGEFYTSYTPYQPEVAQGNLQAMFEYQSLVCQLTGMDVSNASLYDGGTAAVEAVLMCMSVTRRDKRVVAASGVHPEYRDILTTYLANSETELVTAAAHEGRIDLEQLEQTVDESTACVLIQHPNFFGCLEDVRAAGEIAHNAGAMLVQVFDPISLGLLKRPGDLGADIAVAEGQCLGTPMSFGGPYLGVMACREKFVRRLPGRIAGQTTDRRGRRCWVLTLQTREQHIRREKATSNICTNQGLIALRAAIYLASLGPQGLQETAELCLQKTRYTLEQITAADRFSPAFPGHCFKEFVVRDAEGRVDELLAEAAEAGFLAGVSLGRWYPELDDCILVAVTEKRTRSDIERLAACLSGKPCAEYSETSV